MYETKYDKSFFLYVKYIVKQLAIEELHWKKYKQVIVHIQRCKTTPLKLKLWIDFTTNFT